MFLILYSDDVGDHPGARKIRPARGKNKLAFLNDENAMNAMQQIRDVLLGSPVPSARQDIGEELILEGVVAEEMIAGGEVVEEVIVEDEQEVDLEYLQNPVLVGNVSDFETIAEDCVTPCASVALHPVEVIDESFAVQPDHCEQLPMETVYVDASENRAPARCDETHDLLMEACQQFGICPSGEMNVFGDCGHSQHRSSQEA